MFGIPNGVIPNPVSPIVISPNLITPNVNIPNPVSSNDVYYSLFTLGKPCQPLTINRELGFLIVNRQLTTENILINSMVTRVCGPVHVGA